MSLSARESPITQSIKALPDPMAWLLPEVMTVPNLGLPSS